MYTRMSEVSRTILKGKYTIDDLNIDLQKTSS